MRKRTVPDKPWSSPACILPQPAQETQNTGSTSEDVLKTGGCVQKESVNTTPRVGERAASAPELEELRMKDRRNTQSGPGETGGRTHPPPLAEPPHTHEVKEGEGEREEEDAQDEDSAVPLELIRKLIRALMVGELQLAYDLCQFILIYEPDHQLASAFLLKKKQLEEQEAEESNEEDEEEDEEDEEDEEEDEEDDEEDEEDEEEDEEDDKEDEEVEEVEEDEEDEEEDEKEDEEDKKDDGSDDDEDSGNDEQSSQSSPASPSDDDDEEDIKKETCHLL